MNQNKYATEVIEKLSGEKTDILIKNDKFLNCNCTEHTKETKLREGNKIFVVLIKKEDTWQINNTVCWKCSVKNTIERITENYPIAIVEGLLLKKKDKSEYYISEPDVWEIIPPIEK